MSDTTKKIIQDPFLSQLPESVSTFPRGPFDTLPAFEISEGKIHEGYNFLAEHIKKSIPDGLRVLIIDGFQGIRWNEFETKLSASLKDNEVKADWLNIENCYLSSSEIRQKIEPFLGGDDPIFGTHYPFNVEFFLDPKKAAKLKIKASI
ncbi:MAG: hypothetical protein ABI550_07130, partial [Ignavibacteriaceae bacterium]